MGEETEQRPPLIVIGNLQTILRYGPSVMRNRTNWKQEHSDFLAQFLDVVNCISYSSWRSHKLTIGLTDPADTVLPTHEMLLYVAIYFRQLLGGDQLLNRAKNVHARFCESHIRRHWIAEECKAALEVWNNPTLIWGVGNRIANQGAQEIDPPTVRELFDAFLYGCYVFHSYGNVDRKENVIRIRELLRVYSKEILLGNLHGGLMSLHNHCAHVNAAIYQDFQKWFHEESLPRPDIYWHKNLFNRD